MRILLVEDSIHDALFTTRAIRKVDASTEVHHVVDGQEALYWLHSKLGQDQSAWPNLILLDLNLPRMDGRTLLHELKRKPILRAIPIVVMSTSDRDCDVQLSYDGHANAYLCKSMDLVRFQKTIEMLLAFWNITAPLSPISLNSEPMCHERQGFR